MGKEIDDTKNPYLSMEILTPLESRMQEKPEMLAGLNKLKELIGEERYKKYISTIKNMNKRDGMLLVLAESFFQRSMMERECIPAMKEAFDVNRVQIIG